MIKAGAAVKGGAAKVLKYQSACDTLITVIFE